MDGYFLARQGETFGPYTESEFGQLRQSGEYERYSWYWDPAARQWRPVDPAPAAAPKAPEPAPPVQRPGIEVLCHGSRAFVSGRLENATEGAGELVCVSEDASAEFAVGAAVRLSLLDPEGRSMSVTGRIGRVERIRGAWRYRVQWQRLPAILQENPPAAVR